MRGPISEAVIIVILGFLVVNGSHSLYDRQQMAVVRHLPFRPP